MLLCLLAACSAPAAAEKTEPEPSPSEPLYEDQLREMTVTVYTPKNAFETVSTDSVSLRILPYESPAEAAVKELLGRVEDCSISLVSFAETAQTANVNLTGAFDRMNDRQKFVLAYCLTNTLCEFDSISCVNLLVDDKAMGFGNAPCGVFTLFEQDVDTAYWQFSSAVGEASKDTLRYNQKVTLYFGASDGEYLLAEPRDLSFTGGQNVFATVFSALVKGPIDPASISLFPSSAYLSQCDLEKDEATGKQLLSLRIEGSVYAYLTRSNLSPQLAASCAAMTFFDYYPDLSQINIVFDRGQNTMTLLRAQEELKIGTTMELYYPRKHGGLIRLDRIVSTFEQTSVDKLIDLIFDQPKQGNAEVFFPESISRSDIDSVTISDKKAIVHVSETFEDDIRALSAQQERDVLYCVVNTLCRNLDINRVVFYQNGAPLPSIEGRINLSGELFYNPGIIIE